MKNITVSIDDDLYRRARVRAAEQGTSISRVVKGVIEDFARAESDDESSKRWLEDFYADVDARFAGMTGDAYHPGWRDELYEHARAKPGELDKAA